MKSSPLDQLLRPCSDRAIWTYFLALTARRPRRGWRQPAGALLQYIAAIYLGTKVYASLTDIYKEDAFNAMEDQGKQGCFCGISSREVSLKVE